MDKQGSVHPGAHPSSAQEPITKADPSAAFTGGPWECDGNTDGRFYGVSAYREGFRGAPVVVWRGIARPATAEGKANARLIAAAPELFEALNKRPIVSKFCMKDGFDEGGFFEAYEAFSEAARTALRKALGDGASSASTTGNSGMNPSSEAE